MSSPNDAQRWREALDDLGVWKRGEVRAIHKPLLVLMLMARAERHESGEIDFASIDRPMTDLLREFGPPRHSHHPEYPFWYLQNDGFWTVREADAYPLKSGGRSPTRRTLLDGRASGFVDTKLWSELAGNASLRAELTHRILGAYWPPSLHAGICDRSGTGF